MKRKDKQKIFTKSNFKISMVNGNTTPADALREAAKLYDERQATYGNNHDRLASAMIGLFPEGIHLKTPQDHKRFAIIVLMVVKLTRYAVNWDRGGHSDSLKDLSVYAAMLDKIDEKENA